MKALKYERIPSSDIETLRWLISIRYKSAFVLLAVLTFGVLVSLTTLEVGVRTAMAVLVYLVVNSGYALWLRGKPSRRRIELVRQTQLPIELAIFTLGLYFSGGVLTPMFLIYTLSILVSIVLLDPGGAYRTAGTASALYCGLALLEAARLIPYARGYWGERDYYEIAGPVTYALYMLVVPTILMVAAYVANRICLLIGERNNRIESQLHDLRTLHDITNGLSSIVEEEKMVRYLADTLRELQGASLCAVRLQSNDGDMRVRASSGVSTDRLPDLGPPSRSMPGLMDLFEHGKPLILEDLDRHPEYKALSPDPNIKSAYLFPIKVESRVLGSITLAFDRPRPLGQGYNDLLSTVASEAGAALQRVRLFSEAQRLASEMSTLYDLGLHTGSTLSANEVIRRTATNIEKLMSPDIYYIALYDEESRAITFEVFVESGRPMPRMVMDLAQGGLTGRIIESRQPLLVQDWLAEGAGLNAIAKKVGSDMLTYLGVPMMLQDRVIGVMSVQCARPMAFTPHDERLLMGLAAQTAMALENARLHQRVQDQSTFDSMTQVYNHGHFVDLARRAVVGAGDNGAPVSLIMIDVDHFKMYNDTYGHAAGDNVLQLVAGVLKSKVRSGDAVGRWGGEEFAVLLPGAGPREAERIARRFRRAIADLSPVDGQGNAIPSPTISQGISTYPFPSASASELIDQADAALYHAKEGGRDQLGICETADGLALANITAPLHPSQLPSR